MISYIDTQLSIWGKWSIAKASKGIGFSATCPMFKDVRPSGVFASQPPMGVTVDSLDDILSTDAAVQRLSNDQRRLAVEFYVIGGKGGDVAVRLGLERRTLYNRLQALHQAVLGHLNDVVAGV